MHILYFTRDYNVHDQRYLSALAQTEHKVTLLSLESGVRPNGELSLPEGTKTIHWTGGRHPLNWHRGYALLTDFRKLLSEVQPDLIHAGPVQSCAFLSVLTGFHPIVSMSWGYDLLIDAERSGLLQWITRYTLANSDVLVGDCCTIRGKAISYGMRPERIVTYPWGIDLEHFKPNPIVDKGKNTFTLLSTRAWEPIYGVDIIAQAFVRAAQDIPQLRLVMLGGGSQETLLRQTFASGDVFDKVSFPGQVTQSELPGYYQAADLYIAAAHSDGTSISLLEAMACATPVLVSDLSGNQEWVNPGEAGWTFPDGDANALAEGIKKTWEQRSRLPKMGQTARSIVEGRADWKQNFPKLLEAYNLALQVRSASS
jgi:glycosyltransferase involved in cell wall biosynthesis